MAILIFFLNFGFKIKAPWIRYRDGPASNDHFPSESNSKRIYPFSAPGSYKIMPRGLRSIGLVSFPKDGPNQLSLMVPLNKA